MIPKEEIDKASYKALKNVGINTTFVNVFEMGVKFAIQRLGKEKATEDGKSEEMEDVLVNEKFSFIVENKKSITQKAILFGADKFINSANYGSEYGVSVTPTDQKSYLEVLSQIVGKNLKFSGIIIESKNIDQITTVIDICKKGDIPLITQSYLNPNSNHRKEDGVYFNKVDYSFQLRKDEYLHIPVLPDTSFVIKLF